MDVIVVLCIKQKTAYELRRSLVGSEVCIRGRFFQWEDKRALAPEQAGFRKGRSVEEQVFRVVNGALDSADKGDGNLTRTRGEGEGGRCSEHVSDTHLTLPTTRTV